MNYLTLKSILVENPAYTALSNAAIADALNAPDPVPVSRIIDRRGIYAALGFADGLALLKAISTLAASADADTAFKFKEILFLIDAGIDVGHPETRGVIGQLSAGGVISAESAQKLLNLAAPSLAVKLLGGPVSEADVAEAMTPAWVRYFDRDGNQVNSDGSWIRTESGGVA